MWMAFYCAPSTSEVETRSKTNRKILEIVNYLRNYDGLEK